MTEPIITVADELTEASKYAEVIDPRNSVESSEFLTGEELIRVLHPVLTSRLLITVHTIWCMRRVVLFTVILIWALHQYPDQKHFYCWVSGCA